MSVSIHVFRSGENAIRLLFKLASYLLSLCVVSMFTLCTQTTLERKPRWVVYPPFQELMRVESSLAALQRAHQAELCARQALLAELEEQSEVQEQLGGILRWVGELQTTWRKEGLGSFNDNFPMVMESVKKLQDTVAEICDKMPKEPDY